MTKPSASQAQYLRVFFSQIRRKLAGFGLKDIIHTEKGIGYHLKIAEL